MANNANTVHENIAMPDVGIPQSYPYSTTSVQQDNIRVPAGNVTDWYTPLLGPLVSGQGQIFPQGYYYNASDMKVYVVEIDFGSTPVQSATFTITDSNVQLVNFVMPYQAGIAATGRQVDENDMDKMSLVAIVGVGQFTLYAEGRDGPLSGKYKIGYQIGVL